MRPEHGDSMAAGGGRVPLIKRAIRRAAAGPLGRAASRLLGREPGVAVLLYHRVLPARGRDPWSLVVTEVRFREQISFLASRYPVLPLDRALAGLEAGNLPDRHVVCVTFDDGYTDNVTRALPILQALGLPATLFLATGYAASRSPFWWDALDRAPRPLPPRPAPPQGSAGPREAADSRISGGERHGSSGGGLRGTGGPLGGDGDSEALQRLLKGMEADARDRWIERLGPASPVFSLDDLPLGFDVARALPPGFALAGHGHRHVSLGLVPPSAAEADADACAASLRREVPGHLPFFAYPFGGPEDAGPSAAEAVRKAGFTAAFTTQDGIVRRGADPLRLPRIRVADEPGDALAVRLLRTFSRM